MAVLKCKMCGGTLLLRPGTFVAECDSCGTLQTVPSADNETKLNRFNRANYFRENEEFDKGAGIYEAIVSDFPEEAEAYWGLVLCKYGIGYVDDPATGKKIPTLNRAGYVSVLDDPDYQHALQYAAPEARAVYEREGERFEAIRQEIVEVSSREKPYDIFICYKEKDPITGERTEDSVEAQKLYDALSEQGYHVFFSRITLEGMPGVRYEPYIFAALQSAKLMLVVGSDPDYINSPWVKNEWSRYLKLMDKDRSRNLIPCCFVMRTEDLPKELRSIQAQEMGKVGFLQDLLHGIKKLIPLGDKAEGAPNPSRGNGFGQDPSVMLRRGQLLLESKSWKEAIDCYRKILELEPENAKAYFGSFCAKKEKSSLEELRKDIFEWTPEKQPELLQKTPVKQCEQERTQLVRTFFIPNYLQWENMEAYLRYATDLPDYEQAYTERLNRLKRDYFANPDYVFAKRFADDAQRAELEKLEETTLAFYQEQTEKAKQTRFAEEGSLVAAYRAFLWQQRPKLEALYREAELRRNGDYENAIRAKRDLQYRLAINLFDRLGDYRDSRQQLQSCRDALQQSDEERNAANQKRSLELRRQGLELERDTLENRIKDSKYRIRLCKRQLSILWWIVPLVFGPIGPIITYFVKKNTKERLCSLYRVPKTAIKRDALKDSVRDLTRSLIVDQQRLDEVNKKLNSMGDIALIN